MINIYTDGSCISNPGPGGWAAVVEDDGRRQELSGYEPRSTNNRMEILAAIRGLEATPVGAEVTVHSDSEYLVMSVTRGWKRNANKDLWAMLDEEMSKRTAHWRWIRGHAGHPQNEAADRLASRMARTQGREMEGEPAARRRLSHVDASGRASMVDVGWKADTQREAVARGQVRMKPETLALIKGGGFEKGDVLAAARIAGVMGAKKTSELIPLCHPLPLDQVTVDFDLDEKGSTLEIKAVAKVTAKTGVEMEALTAVAIAALTVYDMCKSADRTMHIGAIRLVSKRGGKSGDLILEDS